MAFKVIKKFKEDNLDQFNAYIKFEKNFNDAYIILKHLDSVISGEKKVNDFIAMGEKNIKIHPCLFCGKNLGKLK